MIEKTRGQKDGYRFACDVITGKMTNRSGPTDLIFVLVCSVLQPATAIGMNIALHTCNFDATEWRSCHGHDSHYTIV